MKINFILLLSLTSLFVVHAANSDQYIVKQDKVMVFLKDIDGFAFKIPKEERAGFFQSSQRVSKTIAKILNMKLIYQYVLNNNLVNKNQVLDNVNKKILNYKDVNVSTVGNQSEYDILRNYLIMEEYYKLFQKQLKSKQNKNELVEFAKEKYLINKESYLKVETRDLDYLSLEYNNENKDKQEAKIDKIFQYIKKNGFDEAIKKFEDELDVKVYKNISGFYFTENYKRFSEFVFSTKKLGVIDSILDIDNKYLIVNVKKINGKEYISFDEVKDKILDDLITEKYQREFQYILSQLSNTEIQVNDELIQSLKSRYIK